MRLLQLTVAKGSVHHSGMSGVEWGHGMVEVLESWPCEYEAEALITVDRETENKVRSGGS